jgi:RNA polymerase sigma factor (sigma-70 family)
MHHYHVMTDKDLVCLFQNGEEQAFAELLTRHKSRIYSTIYYLVRDRELAEDLFQDSFIKILTNLRERHYKEEGKFIAWAIRLARNIVIDYFRAQKNMKMVREDEEYSPFDFIPDNSLNAVDEMINNEKLNKVRSLIDRLPDHQREVVILRHYAGLSFKEISDMLKLNLNTCLCRMHYAVNNMRRQMKEQAEGSVRVRRKPGPKPKVIKEAIATATPGKLKKKKRKA